MAPGCAGRVTLKKKASEGAVKKPRGGTKTIEVKKLEARCVRLRNRLNVEAGARRLLIVRLDNANDTIEPSRRMSRTFGTNSPEPNSRRKTPQRKRPRSRRRSANSSPCWIVAPGSETRWIDATGRTAIRRRSSSP